MTDFSKRIVVAAAALMLAGIASAQSWQADVPFAFHIGNRLMQPGKYQISVVSSNSLETYRLLNTEMREIAVVPGIVPHDARKEWEADGQPRLAFECGDAQCTLSEFWTGVSGHPAYEFHVPKHGGDPARLAIIVATPGKTR